MPQDAGAGDFEPDGDIDIDDLMYFSVYWLEGGCKCSNWCDGADLDKAGNVNLSDFAIFSMNWLITF